MSQGPTGHIIAVIGGKGGVGKSVFAANLAVAALQDLRQRPLIIDLDLSSLGDQNTILGLSPRKTLTDASQIVGNIDASTLGPILTHSQAGFSYLAAPRDSSQLRELDLEGVGKLLKAVPKIFPLTIVDCGSSMEPHVLKALEACTAIFVVTTADIIAINQTRRLLTKIQELLFPPEMVQIILNRYSQTDIITPQIIQKNLGRPVFAAIPWDPATTAACLAQGQPLVIAAPATPIARAFHDLIRRVEQLRLLPTLAQLKKPTGLTAVPAARTGPVQSEGQHGGWNRSRSADLDVWTAMKLRIHKALVDQMDLKKMAEGSNAGSRKAALLERTKKAVLDVLAQEDTSSLLPTRESKAQMVKEVLDEALGLGPLEDLLADPTVTEIMVNSRDQIYVERNGKPQMSPVTFSSELQMMNVVERIVSPLGRRVDERVPYVDARLEDGSRVHVIIPPLALRGPTITIRKFPKERITAKHLIDYTTFNQDISDFLRSCVEARLNIIVSGGTGSGKTTLLNVLSNFIPSNERIITVEDSAELQLTQQHVVRLETRPKNIEGEGEVSIRDLVKCCLRMRPDRIVVGECRGGEALDMLQAMNTGHDGSITTIHANNARECLARLETLVTMAGLGIPSKAIRETVASAVDMVIHIGRLSDGSRKILSVTEVTGMQGDVISLQDVFFFKQEGLDKRRKVIGKFVPTGFIPKFVEKLEEKGIKVPRRLFGVAS